MNITMSFPLSFSLRRFQCGDSRIQEYQFHCMGRGWPGQDPTSLETLFPEHTGTSVTVPAPAYNNNNSAHVEYCNKTSTLSWLE